MKNYICLLSFFFFTATVYSQSFEWVSTEGGTGRDIGRSVALDAQGNVYSTGSFGESIDFDPGNGVALLSSNGGADMYIQKLDSKGKFIWAKNIGTSSDEDGKKITVDKSGNVYVTGIFQNTVDFDPGAGTYNLTSKGIEDIFILKLNANGNFIWAKSFGGNDQDLPYGLVVDNVGNVYSTGSFYNTVDFDPGVNTFNLINSGSGTEDGYVQKLDKDGNFIWAYSFGGAQDDRGRSLAIDANGNLIIVGVFFGTVDFDPKTGVYNMTSGYQDVFIQKIDQDANLKWVKQLNGPNGSESVSDIVIDKKDNIILSGAFRLTVDFDPGIGVYNLSSNKFDDFYVLKLDNSGNFIWAKSVGGDNDDVTKSLSCDANNSIYTTGYFSGIVDFDPGAKEHNLTSGSTDIFYLKLSEKGDFIAAQNLGGTGDDDWGTALSVDKDKKVLITGFFSGITDFDPGSGTSNKTSVGGYDIFLLKWNTCPNSTSSTLNKTACTSYTVPSGKKTYTTSGIYKDTIPNYLACDSIITINLTIVKPTSSNISKQACTSYTVPSGKKTYTTSGIYKDTIPSSGGCDSIITINLTIVKIDATVTNTANTLTATQAGAIYQWLDCKNSFAPIPGKTGKSFSPTANGDYAVSINKDGCSDTSNCISITTIGIMELSIENKVSIYPNPVSDMVNFSLLNPLKNASIRIFDVNGKLTWEETNKTGNEFSFDLSRLAAGSYYFEIIDTKTITRIKFIKE